MEKDENMTDKNPEITEATAADAPASLGRRAALFKLGLATAAVYAAPALLTLSEAEAGRRRSGRNPGRKSGRRNNRRSRRSRRSS